MLNNTNTPEDTISCKEYAQSNMKFLRWGVFYAVVIFIIYTISQNDQQRVNNLLLSFNQGKEIRCKNEIVSLKNGFTLSKDQLTVSNGKTMYGIYFCTQLEGK